MSEPLLVLEGVNKVYPSGSEELRVLKDLTVSVEASTITVVTGESGSGKSTLLNLLGGLDAPTSGTVRVGPYLVSHMDEDELTVYRRGVLGFIFQFHYLLREFSALENIMLPALIAGVSKDEAHGRAAKLLDEIGLSARGHHYPSQLSGGERQRIAVARSLINDPLLVLADEPTGNLDEGNSRMVEDLLFSLVRSRGKTLVLVTHDLNLARRGDRRFHLFQGSLSPT